MNWREQEEKDKLNAQTKEDLKNKLSLAFDKWLIDSNCCSSAILKGACR